MIYILLTFIITTLTKCCSSCGVSTHISIANEALQSFVDTGEYNVSYRDIILSNFDAFYAGSNYPDAMYPSICFGGRYHSISEDTHWVPFLNATANYIRKTYPKPWSKATEKLIAFTFGVVSHQVADVTWHSLGIDQGFLQVMANINFHGSFSTAHPLGDIGGDMVSIFEGDVHDIALSKTWYLPVDDLVNIYKELYGEIKIDENIIIPCSALLYAEWIGEKLAGSELFTFFASKSPFLVEKLHSYFLGGKSDMAAWSSIIWHVSTHLIETGPADCELPRNPLYIRCNKSLRTNYIDESSLKSRPRKISLIHLKNVNDEDVKMTRVLRGVNFNIRGNTASKLRRVEQKFQKKVKKSETIKSDHWTSEPFIFSTTNKYAKLGWSLISGQLPGYGEVLITAAPWYGKPGNSQHGRVYILSTSKNYLVGNFTDIDKSADQILEGSIENSRFGYSLALLDYNADGLNDLAVSAPSQGSNFLNYTGAVYIYYGNRKTGGVNNKADVIIIGEQRYSNLGTRLLAADINLDGFNDIIIGSKYSPMGGEQQGSVIAFLSRKTNTKIQQRYFSGQADLVLKGEQNYSWFGHDFSFHKNTSVGPVLIVSAPTYRICALKNCSYSQDDIQSAGKLYGYNWSSKSKWNLLFEVVGQSSFSQLGISTAIGDPFGNGNDILAVSLPTSDVYGFLPLDVQSTFEQAGQIFLLSLKMLAGKHHVTLPGVDYVSRFEGNHAFGRFGWHVGFLDSNNDGVSDLILGSPYQTKDVFKPTTDEEGAVYIYYGGNMFPRGNATRDCDELSIQPCPKEKASVYLSSAQKFSQFGHKLVRSTFKNTPSIVISAPRQSVTSSLNNGAIYVIPISGIIVT